MANEPQLSREEIRSILAQQVRAPVQAPAPGPAEAQEPPRPDPPSREDYIANLVADGVDPFQARLMAENRPHSEDHLVSNVPRVAGNILRGGALATGRIVDELTTDPDEFWDRHWGNHDKYVDGKIKSSRSEPVVGFVKNAGEGLIHLVTFAPQIAYALSAAANESPEAAADLFENMAGGILAGTAHIVANPIDNLEADPFGTVATVSGFASVARGKAPGLLKRAREHMPAPQRAKFDQFVEQSGAIFEGH